MDIYTVCGREIFVLLPPEYHKDECLPVLYFHDGKDTAPLLEKAEHKLYGEGRLKRHITVALSTGDRLKDLTPWAGKAISHKFKDFGGGGDAYIAYIENNLIPFINEKYSARKEASEVSIGGVSLGGIMSIYALYKSNLFGNALCISGSFWYYDFIEFLKSNSPKNKNAEIILISGKDEGKGKPEPLDKTTQYAEEAAEILKGKTNRPVNLLWDEGGHHHNRQNRIEEGLLRLYK